MKSAFRQNAEAQKFVQQKTTLAAAGQRLYNQTKNRKEGFQVNIKIIQRQCGGTEFLSQPHRLHLGAQNAAGVDELCFTLPKAWAGCTVALYLRRSDGTLLAPVSLDTQHCVTVDRRLTEAPADSGCWQPSMPAATPPIPGPAATTPTPSCPPTAARKSCRPRSMSSSWRVCWKVPVPLPPPRSVPQPVLQARHPMRHRPRPRHSAPAPTVPLHPAVQPVPSCCRTAEELVPTDGQVVSVNGKSGIVKLTAQDVGALPCPAVPVSGQLLRVLSVDPNTGAVLTDTAAMPDLSPYLRSSTVPTASAPGAVRVDPACGINVRSDGTLIIAPAAREQLDSMTDALLPLTAALLPYGVKKALTTAAAAGEWTAAEKANALRTFGADFSSYYTKEDVDALLAAPSSAAYPVGSIYQSTDPTSPAALFGGTWEQIASDRVLMGASRSHAAGTTVKAGLPNITGSFVADVKKGEHKVSGAFTAGDLIASTGEYNSFSDVYKFSLDASKSNAIYGRSATVQPAAYYVHIWRRVA